jgi:hypothetical protein
LRTTSAEGSMNATPPRRPSDWCNNDRGATPSASADDSSERNRSISEFLPGATKSLSCFFTACSHIHGQEDK